MERTSDGRFRSKRVKLVNRDLKSLLENVKSRKSWSWNEFAEFLGVSEYTLRHEWRKEGGTVPLPIFEKLNRISSVETEDYELIAPFEGQSKGGRKSSSAKGINRPAGWTDKFAEFYGVLLGDGCIYSNKNSVCITGNAEKDEQYMNYLSDVVREIFGIRPHFYRVEKENVLRLVLNSRELSEFLIDRCFPAGSKKQDRLSIPGEILRQENLIKPCLRGLLDTDGGVYSHPHSGIMLDITVTNQHLLSTVEEALEKIDVAVGITNDRVQVYGEKKVDKFFEEIGSSNPRNICRHRQFRREGEVPSDLETLLKSTRKEYDVPYFGSVV